MKNAVGRSLRIVIALFASALAQNAWSSVMTTTVDSILLVENTNLVYVYPSGGVVGVASCAAHNEYYSFSMTRPRAREYLSALLMAHASGAQVTIWGKGNCTDQSTAETLDYFRLD